MKTRRNIIFALLAAAIVLLIPVGLMTGGVSISAYDALEALTAGGDSLTHFIVVESRLPAIVTALLGGAALSVAGLLMQTCFDNPLAGPSIMGISSGASVGVALVMMMFGSAMGTWGNLAVILGAMAGAMSVLVLLLFFSGLVRSADVLLIVGILIGYLASSVITLLNFFGAERAVHSFVIWGMGSFDTVGLERLPLFSAAILVLLCLSMLYAKSLNALLFGSRYAESVGVSATKVRTALLCLAGGLTAVVTAWCGPIGFLGLVVPHIARMLLRTSNHFMLLPATALCGALLGLLCRILSASPAVSSGATVPVNAITPFIGVPVIIYVLLNRKKLLYFN